MLIIASSDQVLKSDASSNDDRLKLSCWGLPLAVLQRYEERGVTSLFAWQAECLCSGKVLGKDTFELSAWYLQLQELYCWFSYLGSVSHNYRFYRTSFVSHIEDHGDFVKALLVCNIKTFFL